METDNNITYKPIDHNSSVNKTVGLVEFEMVMDLDLAIAAFVLHNLKDEKLIKEDLGIINSVSGLKNLLLFRKHPNPLTAIIKDSYIDSCDKILKELLEKYENEIYDIITPTDIASYIHSSSLTKGLVSNIINCSNDIQVKKINELFKNKCSTITNETDMTGYNSLYIKNIQDLPKYAHIDKKHVYVLNSVYNMKLVENGYIVHPIFILYSEKNMMRVIDYYNDLSIPKMEELLWDKSEQEH